MGDYNDIFRHVTEIDQHKRDADKKLRDERNRAEAEMAYRFANLAMPEDIRSRARAWGMEGFCEVLWNSAFQAGYREASRATTDSEDRKEGA